uniref:LytR/AlgR family response regulator transcription factor n=1 Tax=Flavobacterium sp. TaxID=239 RepID=UPI00404A4452
MKKVIIIDDESAGRQLINEYLKYFPELVVLGEANNGVDAVKIINEFKPDLIFLDIQIPGLTGFEVLSHLNEIPNIIFSTAYDSYALQAFEVHAIDYLLKPYTKERFQKAIEKLKWENEINSITPLAESLLIEKQTYPERILVNKNKKLITISVSNIIRVEAYGDYSKLYTNDVVFISNYGISILEEKLNPKNFIRVHRSSIVNLKQIKEVQRYGKTYEILMINNDKVKVSLSYMDNLKGIIF